MLAQIHDIPRLQAVVNHLALQPDRRVPGGSQDIDIMNQKKWPEQEKSEDVALSVGR